MQYYKYFLGIQIDCLAAPQLQQTQNSLGTWVCALSSFQNMLDKDHKISIHPTYSVMQIMERLFV